MHIDSNQLFSKVGLTETSGQATSDTHRKIISTIEIDVGDGEPKMLHIRQFQDPYLLAVEFCNKYGLNHKAVAIIEKKIEESLRKQDKKEVKEQKSVSPQPTKKNPQEIGNKLYEKGLKLIQKAEENRIKKLIEIEQDIGRQATFKPKINVVSQKIVQMRKEVGGVSRDNKKSPIRRIQNEMEGCTFKPEINKVSQRIVKYKNADRQEDRVNELYYDSIRIANKRKQALEKQQFTYKPKLNNKANAQITQNFLERLESHMIKKKELEQKTVVPDEECSFVPKIGRPPRVDRNKQNLPIGDYLLSKASRSDLNEHSRSVSFSKSSETTVKNRNSENIYYSMLQDRIAEIFQSLDSDRDGLISPECCEIDGLSARTLQFLQPLFREMEELEAILDETMFRKSFLKLFQSSDINSRSAFLAERWQKQDEPKHSFKPELNTRSRKILQEKGYGRVSLYEQAMKTKQKSQARVQNAMARREQKELEECTFQPRLNNNSQIFIKKVLGESTTKRDRD